MRSISDRQRGLLAAAVLLVFALCGAALTSAQIGQLAPNEKRGKRIYDKGESDSGGEIVAVLGKESVETPASILPCAGCHGLDGRGKPEGGVTPSNIIWEELTKPYEVALSGGRRRGPYNGRSLVRAITMGIDPAGNQLHAAMPRYRLSRQDAADLLSYLKRLGKNPDEGLGDASIRIGAPLTAGSETDQTVKSLLSAYFKEVNQQGGIHGRRLELVAGETANPEKTFRQFIETEQVFALSFMARIDDEMARLAEEEEIPVVGAFSLHPQARVPVNRYVFYLYSGVQNQALALAAFASKGQGVKKRRVVIVRSVDTRSGEIAELVKQAGSAAGWSRVEEALVDGVQSNLSALVNKLKNSGAEVIIYLGPPGAEAAFLREAQSASWSPIFLVPGSLVGGSIFDAPAAFDGRIFIAYPTLPTDRSPDALAEYRRLAEAHRLDARHLTIQLTALSSAKILVEALKRAGRDLSRAKLIESLEALYQFRTGLTPAVTFGPNRRVGATGAYVVSVDLKEKTFVPVSDWIQIN